MSNEQTVQIGDDELRFDIGVTEVNDYFDDTMPDKKIQPAWNLLATTVVTEDKELLKELLTVDDIPNGAMVMGVVGVLIQQYNSGAKISLKKPSQ